MNFTRTATRSNRDSNEDRLHNGKWQTQSIVGKDDNHAKYLFVHIPKAGGSSFLRDSPQHYRSGASMTGNGELDACHGSDHSVNIPSSKTVIMMPVRYFKIQFHTKTCLSTLSDLAGSPCGNCKVVFGKMEEGGEIGKL